jgi:DNA-binding MarR family transcriptional regulator
MAAMAAKRSGAAEAAVGLALSMDRLRARLRSESGLGASPWSRSQLAALNRVVQGPPSTTSDLAAAEYMRPQSMAQILAALEEGGLVARRPDPGDGRRVLITPTEQGRDVVRSALEAREAWLAGAIERALDDEERAALPVLVGLLDRLADCDAPPVAGRGIRSGRS